MEGTNTQYNQMFNAQAPTVEPATEEEKVLEPITPEVEVEVETVQDPIPEAEPTPAPTPAPAPTPIRRVGRVCAEAALNIRKQPNATAGIVCVVKTGEELKISTWNNPDWYKVSTATGRIGYCMKKFVTVE